MPRRARVIKRETKPDAKYNSVTTARFLNRMMTGGKKSTVEKVVYNALHIIEQQEAKDPISVLEQAVRNATPQIEVKPRRVGGATYQVPVEVRPDRSLSLAIRWLVTAARARTGKSMAEKLASEIIDASNKQGSAIKKRDDTHKMAEANRAFAHYKW